MKHKLVLYAICMSKTNTQMKTGINYVLYTNLIKINKIAL